LCFSSTATPLTNIYTLSLHDALPILNEIKELLENQGKYTEESLKKLEGLMREAADILKEKTATVDEIKEIITALTNAKDSLEIEDRKSTRLNSSHVSISYAVFCLKKK